MMNRIIKWVILLIFTVTAGGLSAGLPMVMQAANVFKQTYDNANVLKHTESTHMSR